MGKRSKEDSFKYHRVDLARDDSSDESDDLDRVLGPPSKPLSTARGRDKRKCCRTLCIILTVLFVLGGLATALSLSIFVFPTGLKEALFLQSNGTLGDGSNSTNITSLSSEEGTNSNENATTTMLDTLDTTTKKPNRNKEKNKANKAPGKDESSSKYNTGFGTKDDFQYIENGKDKRNNEGNFFRENTNQDFDFTDLEKYVKAYSNSPQNFQEKQQVGESWLDNVEGERGGYLDGYDTNYYEDGGVEIPLNQRPDKWNPQFVDDENGKDDTKRNDDKAHNKKNKKSDKTVNITTSTTGKDLNQDSKGTTTETSKILQGPEGSKNTGKHIVEGDENIPGNGTDTWVADVWVSVRGQNEMNSKEKFFFSGKIQR